MRRRALAIAAAPAIATMLTAAAIASAAAPPKALTHQYPLGTQTLCCQSQSATTPSPAQSATTPAPTPSGAAPTPASAQRHHPAATPNTGHGSAVDWILIAVAIVAAVLLLLLNWLRRRRSRRVVPRPRRAVPHAALVLLSPIYRYDHDRDAWILRAIGNRYGPVLRPGRYRTHPRWGARTARARPKREPPPLTIRPRRK